MLSNFIVCSTNVLHTQRKKFFSGLGSTSVSRGALSSLIWNNFLVCLSFKKLYLFEAYRLVFIFVESPQFGFIWCFLLTSDDAFLAGIQKKWWSVILCRHLMSVCSIPGGHNPEYLVRGVCQVSPLRSNYFSL